MSEKPIQLDVAIVGSGPNGLAAALILARAGLHVEVFEGASTPGGGCRTEELTLPGYRHDVCSIIQSMTSLSPFFHTLDLQHYGVQLLEPEVAFAHPLDSGTAGALVGGVDSTAQDFGIDARAYRSLMGPLVAHAEALAKTVLAPIRSLPTEPLTMARFALAGLFSTAHLEKRFSTPEVRALIAGVSAHSMSPLTAPLTAAFGLFLAVTAHSGGWPVVEGGSARLVDAMATALVEAGGVIHTRRWITKLADLPPSRATMFDTSVESMVAIAGDRLPARFRRDAGRFQHAPGICKIDWALSGPVPWTAASCRSTATVHLGGTFEEIAAAEAEVASGHHPDRPYCIVVQPSVVDESRAPKGHGTLWAYCHVPQGSTVDMTSEIEAQIERFAPGFKDLILAKVHTTAADSELHNPNYVGGDIGGGAGNLRQTLFRPTLRWNNYRTGAPNLYLCSASTPPGGGVHGMCGAGAAKAVLADFGHRVAR